jgi:hypothetical protein
MDEAVDEHLGESDTPAPRSQGLAAAGRGSTGVTSGEGAGMTAGDGDGSTPPSPGDSSGSR